MARIRQITELLQAWSRGDSQALAKLVPLVDRELRNIAHAYMSRERAGHTLQTTALVNEALIRFITAEKISWQSRTHFFAVAATKIRRILVDYARKHGAAKRGGGARVTLDDTLLISHDRLDEVLACDQVLIRLEELDPRQGRIVVASTWKL
jgi:RNA polymerase sigma factor (TIGR02999 family)